MSYAWATTRLELMDMTSIADGRTHAITSAEFELGLLAGTGRYLAVCGTDVVVASMVACPGPRCPRCAEHRQESERAAIPPRLVVRLARRARNFRPGGPLVTGLAARRRSPLAPERHQRNQSDTGAPRRGRRHRMMPSAH